MDDNPWGASSVDGSPNLTSSATPPDQPEATSRLSLDAEEEDASWGNDEVEQVDEVRDVEERKEEESDIDQQPTEDVEAGTRVGEQEEEVPAVQAADQSEQGRDGSATLESSTTLPPPVPLVDETPPGSHEPPMDDFPEGDVGLSAPDASLSPTTKDSETFTVPPPPLPTTSTEPSQAPPMDDFDDFDDDDDFGEMGEAGEDGEGDDDFGDFGDAAPLDESAFEASSEPFPLTQHTSEPALTPQPVPSTSFLPPLRLDLSNRPTRRSVAPQLRDFVSSAWGDVSDKVNDEPERQVEGVAQILVTEESRNLLSSLSSLPPLRPLDWRRSKIRREHLISMGIPVNLDDSNDPKPLSSLSTSSPRLSGTQSRPSSAPPGASPLPFSSSRVPSRSSTPFADRERTRRTASPPPLDKNLADQLLSLKEDDLTLMSLAKLKSVAADLEKISVDASEILTHALLMREKESQDKETYNGMISDLVSAAAKMKTTSSTTGAGRGRDPKRQGSLRWGRGGG